MDAYRNVTAYAGLSSIGVTRGTLARIDDGRGMRLHIEHGSVWLTQDGSNKDVFLQPGDSFTIQRNGRTLLSTLKSRFALIRVEPAAAGR
jgi:hypothetical protein